MMVPRFTEVRCKRSIARVIEQGREYREWRGALISIRIMPLLCIGMLSHSNSYSIDIRARLIQASCSVVAHLEQLHMNLTEHIHRNSWKDDEHEARRTSFVQTQSIDRLCW